MDSEEIVRRFQPFVETLRAGGFVEPETGWDAALVAAHIAANNNEIAAVAEAVAAGGRHVPLANAPRSVTGPAAVTNEDPPEAVPPDRFDAYELVLLWSVRERAELEPDAAWRLQRQHLGHLDAMRIAGHLLVAGPLVEQPDPRLRGMCIYRVGSVERARELASSDPAVKAGQLEVEVMQWMTPPDALAVKPVGEALEAPS